MTVSAAAALGLVVVWSVVGRALVGPEVFDLPFACFLLLTGAWVAAESASSPRSPVERRRVDRQGSHQLVSGLGLLVSQAVAVWEYGASPGVRVGAGWVLAAALLISLGACLRLAAVRTLGPAFHSADVVTEDQALVTTGLYGRLRHPSEAGLLLIALGTAALFSSFGALLITLLVLVPATLRRVHVEDEMLGALFPEHALWKAQVPALLPR
jgi:protein-S-isoprenylcysteine O-methyltransferase Ste14